MGDAGAADKLIVGDARSMSEVPDASVAMVVTSPSYLERSAAGPEQLVVEPGRRRGTSVAGYLTGQTHSHR